MKLVYLEIIRISVFESIEAQTCIISVPFCTKALKSNKEINQRPFMVSRVTCRPVSLWGAGGERLHRWSSGEEPSCPLTWLGAFWIQVTSTYTRIWSRLESADNPRSVHRAGSLYVSCLSALETAGCVSAGGALREPVVPVVPVCSGHVMRSLHQS